MNVREFFEEKKESLLVICESNSGLWQVGQRNEGKWERLD